MSVDQVSITDPCATTGLDAYRVRAASWLSAHFPAATEEVSASPPPPYTARATSREDVATARRAQRTLADAGYAGIAWPQQYGGAGGTESEKRAFDEVAGRHTIPTGIFSIATGLAAPALLVHGSEEQKRTYLPRIARGEHIWCQLFSEPDAGSDLAGLRTRAVVSAAGWQVNGQKIWSSGAQHADWGILVARTDPIAAKHRGLSFFLVDMSLPGIEVRPIRQIDRGSHFAEVFFTDVQLPPSSLLGAEGEGWTVVQTILNHERMATSDSGFGLDSEILVALARDTHSLADVGKRRDVAALVAEDHALHCLMRRTTLAHLAGSVNGPEASLLKLAAARYLRSATELGLSMLGTEGALVGTSAPYGGAWQSTFLSAPSLRLVGGTDEIQRNIVAERFLGLPRESDPTKGVSFAQVRRSAR